MRRLLRSILKVPDEKGLFHGNKTVLLENFQEVYKASDLEWSGPEEFVWLAVRLFWIEYNDLPTPDDVKDSLDRELKADVKVLVDEIVALPFMETASVEQRIKELRDTRQIRHFLTFSKEAMMVAAQGQKIGKEDLKGVKDAVRYLMGKVVPLTANPWEGKRGGNPREDASEMKELYIQAATDKSHTVGVLTGIDKIDEVTHGIQIGNLMVVAAFTSEGKTTIMMNMVYNAVFRQGFNAIVFSREMTYDQLRMLFYVIHSNHPKFGSVHEPLKYDDVKNGNLTKEAQDFYINTLIPDFSSNPDYGKLYIEQPSLSLSIVDVQVRSEFLNTQFPIDLICIDYLSMLDAPPGRRFSEKRDLMNSLFIESKQLSLAFDGGKGTRVLTGHQLNRTGKEKAEDSNGVYRTQALSDVSEAERSSDIIIANYLSSDLRAMGESKVTCLKNRDGKVPEPFNLVMKLELRVIGNLSDIQVSQDQLLDLEF